MLLDQIRKANDIKQIPREQWGELAEEIRKFLVEITSRNGGHIASNLGVVELTMALHLTFDLPKDKIIWDVGHQAYTHKLLTGRKKDFDSIRTYGGLSGFPKREESNCDAFDTGHSSTSISAGLGYVRARELTGEDYRVISVVGDGSLTGGMSYEALNNAAQAKSNFIIVLNDNEMSISENVGGISRYLDGIRTAKGYTSLKKKVKGSLQGSRGGRALSNRLARIKNSFKQLFVPGMFFEDMGITYLGPIDGYNIRQMQKAFREASRLDHAVIVHVVTKKGKGYRPAEEDPARFHGVGAFDIETGESIRHSDKETCTEVFSRALMREAQEHDRLVAVTAAMKDGTGLSEFASVYPDRFFDVGIAEEHAVTFSAGLAAGGLLPVVCIYSSFLQRGFDQIIHDVCLQNLHVIFMVDRAGLVGNDGETHQGLFDLSYLSLIPNMTVMAPKNKWELEAMLHFAIYDHDGPIAIRYPRGTAFDQLRVMQNKIRYGKSETIIQGEDVAVFSEGHMMKTALRVTHVLEENGYHPTLVNARFIKPLDTALIDAVAREHRVIVTIEENAKSGGYGEHLAAYVEQANLPLRVFCFGIDDIYVKQGSIATLKETVGLDWKTVSYQTLRFLKEAGVSPS